MGDSCQTCSGGRTWDGDSCECGSGWVWNGISCEPNTCIDTAPPTMGIGYISGGLYLYDSPVTRFKGLSNVFVEMFDNLGGSGINRIEFKVDGQPICTTNSTPTPHDNLYYSSCPWDTTSISNGQHNLSITLYDNCDNRTQVSETVTVDNRCESHFMWRNSECVPEVIFSWPMNGFKLADRDEITVETHDSIAHVQLKLNGIALGPVLDPFSGSTFWYNWETSTVPDGNYTITAEAWDDNGNVYHADPVTFIVQNSPDFCAAVRDLNGKWLKNCGPEMVYGIIELQNDPQNETCWGRIDLNSPTQWVNIPDVRTAEYSHPPQSGNPLTVHLWVQNEAFTCEFY